MGTFKQIEKELEEVKLKRREFILSKLDGRTQSWVSENTGISRLKISNWINSVIELTPEELKKVSELLKVKL